MLFILGIATGLLVYYVFDEKKIVPHLEELVNEEYEQELSKLRAELAALKTKKL